MNKWTRRAVITTGGLVGGGLLLGIGGIAFAPNRLRLRPEPKDATQLVTWLKITPDNEVVALIPHCEMGQGTLTACAMLLAEELEADWNRVRIEQAPAEDVYANGYIFRAIAAGMTIPQWLDRSVGYLSYKGADLMGLQLSAGSTGIRGTGQFGMLTAGAAARQMLLQAAAKRWNVSVASCAARNSQVLHTASARTATYGELASAAAELKPPEHPRLKPRSQYKLVGTAQPRFDLPAKVNGTAEYAIDATLPDLLYAAITLAPVQGEKLASVDSAPAKKISGVHAVIELENAVVVVARSYWTATKALRTLQPVFADGGHRSVTTASLFAQHERLLAEKTKQEFVAGDGASAMAGRKSIEAEYRVPYLAHATMEPMVATARIASERCEVWTGTQDPLNARRLAAKTAEMDFENVTMHNLQLGGGFGRRSPGQCDFVEQAVRIAKVVSPAPVKLIWSREQDMQQDFYRPAAMARFRGALDQSGRAAVWTCSYTGSGGQAARPIYQVEHQELRSAEAPGHLRVGYWRSVDHSQHGFFMESFVDELAHAAGQDPLAYRKSLLTGKPRHVAVLDRVAQMSNWGTSLEQGYGRGVAIVESFGSITAQVAEVHVTQDGQLRVRRVFSAVDCGQVVNTDTARAQMAGGIVFGLTAALFGEITIKDGQVEQTNFPSYEMVHMKDAPEIIQEFVSSDAPMGGLGESGVPPLAPAVTNAIFAATGQRIRSLPIKQHSLVNGQASI